MWCIWSVSVSLRELGLFVSSFGIGFEVESVVQLEIGMILVEVVGIV